MLGCCFEQALLNVAVFAPFFLTFSIHQNKFPGTDEVQAAGLTGFYQALPGLIWFWCVSWGSTGFHLVPASHAGFTWRLVL